MKKSILFAAMFVFAAVLVGCNSKQDPTHDTTKLWPAYNSSTQKWGFIDAKGNFAIQAMYDEVNDFSCGYAKVTMSGQPKYIDKKGNIQTTASMDYAYDFYYNHARFYLDGRYGMINKKFENVLQPIYSGMGYMGDNGLVGVQMSSNDKVGYVNAKGEQKIQATYDGGYTFEDGGAVVVVGGKCGVIDKKGQYTIAPTYDDLDNLGQGVIGFYQNGKYGAMDLKGNTVIQPMYDDYDELVDNDMIPVAQNDKWGYVDTKGNVKIATQYYSADPFFEGYAWVCMTDGAAYNLIDTKGNVKLTLGKDEYPRTGMHNGLALVKSDSNTGTIYKFIDVKGKVVYTYSFNSSYYPSPAKAPVKHGKNEMVEQTLHFSSKNLH